LQLVSAAADCAVRVWRIAAGDLPAGGLAAGTCLFTLEFGPRNPAADFVLRPDTSLIVCSWDGVLRNIDTKSRKCVSMVQAASAGLRAICCGEEPTGGEPLQVFVGTDDCHISTFGLSQDGEWEPRRGWKAHNGQVNSLRIYKSWLISASDDRSIRIWVAATGVLLEDFRGHAGGVIALEVAFEDKLIWSGSRDWTVRSWDLAEIEHRVRELKHMTKADQESTAEEAAIRAAAKAAKKKKGNKAKKTVGGARRR